MPDDGSVPRFDVTDDMVAGRPMRNLGALQTSELFLLSAMRLWCGHDNTPCGRALVRNGFHAVSLTPPHYTQFAELMACVTGGARRRFCTARACCAPVMHDEAWLLECFALAQHHRPYETTELLAALLRPAAVRVAAEALDSLAAALAGVGLHLRIRSMDAPVRPATLWRHSLSRLPH